MSKRFLSILLTLLLALSLVPQAASAEGDAWMEFYVSPNGNDNGSGTQASPFQTLERARDEVRKYNKNMQGDITVNLMPGRYEQSDSLEFEQEDSGTNGFKVIWQGTDPNNLPVISGGKQITGTWTEGENGIWHVKAENLSFARDLFVNGQKATRAKSAKRIYGLGVYSDPDVKMFNAKTGKEIVPELGFYVDKTKLGLYENPEDIEFYWSILFRTSVFHVDDIIQDPANENRVIVLMDRSHWGFFRANQAQSVLSATMEQYGNYQNGFVVENAYELMDEPGEFYFNKKTKVLSYIPREGEDLNNAEVVCPQIDRLTFIHGGNYYNRVSNIQFKNIQFSHTSDLYLERANLYGAQGENHYSSYTYDNYPFGSNVVEWAENLSFESCIFYGLGPVGLQFREGVFDSQVEGNVFADIGASGFIAGGLGDRYFSEPSNFEGPVNAAAGTPWLTSYQYQYPALGGSASERSKSAMTPWYSEPWAKEEGTCPYVLLQFDDSVRLENFEFSFPATATDEERSNFEIIVSKDIDLKESKVIATYTDPVGFKENVPIGDGIEWRYLMIRKTVPGPFCLNGVWAWTYDIMVQGQMGAPGNCVIANNYFTRCATEKNAAFGIQLNYTADCEVVHNEIYDVPYTGISVGWGWDWALAKTSKNNNISYNKMVDNQTIASDGSGIYIFGEQPGSTLHGNYTRNLSGMAYGIYMDSGANGITLTDNVIMHAGQNIAIATAGAKNIKVRGLYSSDFIGGYDEYIGRDTIDMEPTIFFSYSNRPDVVARVEAEAGIEDEWLWIKDRIPEAEGQREHLLGMDAWESTMPKARHGFKSSERRLGEAPVMAQNILDSADFGLLPWNFKPEFKGKLEKGMANLPNNQNRSDDVGSGHQEEMIDLDTTIKEALDSVYHPSYEEMISMCDSLLKSATTSKYPKKAIDTFEKEYAAIKATNPATRGDKGVAANQLEKVYTALYDASYYPEIVDVVVENAETVIDREHKTVTVQLPFGTEPGQTTPDVFVNAGTRMSKPIDQIDYSSGTAQIPLYKTTTKTYDVWTLKLVTWSDDMNQAKSFSDPTAWVGGNINTTKSQVDGAFVVEPWWQPTMHSTVQDGPIKFSVSVPRADTVDGFGFIFNAQTTDLKATYYEDKNTYYMANFKGDSVTLYQVNGGDSTRCASADGVYLEYDAFNDIEISVQEAGIYDRITIKLADEILIDTLVDKLVKRTGHFGILSKNMTIKVK